ncbi:hypothetical protein [Streptomyces sp. NPDC088910]|uniref:hypothetical protein n=2 Tax=unclassified Streptomyces TaxID=2593676 RepID=UPI0037F9AB78
MRVHCGATAAALTATAVLTLSACGGGGGGGSDTIDGDSANTASPTATAASPTASASAEPTAPPVTQDPNLALPGDLKLVFDWPAPTGHAEAAALGNAANFMRSIAHGIVKRNVNEPLVAQYAQPGGSAAAYARTQIGQAVDGGWTETGTDRFYRPTVKVTSAKTAATVGFCDFQGKVYGKDVRSGKLLGTAVTDSSYVYFTIVMAKFPAGADLWQAVSVDAKAKATQCKE